MNKLRNTYRLAGFLATKNNESINKRMFCNNFPYPIDVNRANKAIVRSTMCIDFDTTTDLRLNLANQ
jgi:hypothetical protein